MSEPVVVTPAIIRAVLIPHTSTRVDWVAQRLSMALYEKVKTLMLHDPKGVLTLVVSTKGRLGSEAEKRAIVDLFKQAGWKDPLVHVVQPQNEYDEGEVSLVVQSHPIE